MMHQILLLLMSVILISPYEASALTHSDGSGISESFLKIDTADADHWKGFDVLLCALM